MTLRSQLERTEELTRTPTGWFTVIASYLFWVTGLFYFFGAESLRPVILCTWEYNLRSIYKHWLAIPIVCAIVEISGFVIKTVFNYFSVPVWLRNNCSVICSLQVFFTLQKEVTSRNNNNKRGSFECYFDIYVFEVIKGDRHFLSVINKLFRRGPALGFQVWNNAEVLNGKAPSLSLEKQFTQRFMVIYWAIDMQSGQIFNKDDRNVRNFSQRFPWSNYTKFVDSKS